MAWGDVYGVAANSLVGHGVCVLGQRSRGRIERSRLQSIKWLPIDFDYFWYGCRIHVCFAALCECLRRFINQIERLWRTHDGRRSPARGVGCLLATCSHNRSHYALAHTNNANNDGGVGINWHHSGGGQLSDAIFSLLLSPAPFARARWC